MTEAIACTSPALSRKATQVLEAAKNVFLRDGYSGASMDTVSREAGVSKATLYAHFSSKDKLFAAVIASECERHVRMLEQVEAEKLPIREALIRFGTNFVDFLQRPEVIAIHRQIIAEAPRFPELGRAFYAAGPTVVLRILADFLQRAAARGEIKIVDPELAAQLFISLVKGEAQFRMELGFPPVIGEERDRLVELAVEIFVRGLGPA